MVTKAEMSSIILLQTGNIKMDEPLRREDLEALGGMAGLVGAYMNDFANRTDGSERRNLFKSNLNPKATVANAVKMVNDDPARRIISDSSPLPVAPQNLPPRAGPPPPPPGTITSLDNAIITARSDDKGVFEMAPGVPQLQQLEFGFINQRVPNYGTVGDVIKHFNSRLDNLEESIKLIKVFVVEARATMSDVNMNMPKRKNKKNASEKIT